MAKITKKAFTEKLIEKHGLMNIQTTTHATSERKWITKFFVGTFYAKHGFLERPVHCGTWCEGRGCFDSDGSQLL